MWSTIILSTTLWTNLTERIFGRIIRLLFEYTAGLYQSFDIFSSSPRHKKSQFSCCLLFVPGETTGQVGGNAVMPGSTGHLVATDAPYNEINDLRRNCIN